MQQKRDQREEFTRERELELFYTLTSPKNLQLTGAVSGALMPWIPFLIVIGSILISNIYDYFMWAEWVFDPISLFKETGLIMIGSTLILAVIGYIAGAGFPKEKVRFMKTDIYFSRPFSYFVLGFFFLMSPFSIVVFIMDKNFTLLAIPVLFVLSLLVSLVAYPYWKAIFNRVIYRLSDYDAVGAVEKESLEARSKQNVTRQEEEETYRRFLEEMRKHR